MSAHSTVPAVPEFLERANAISKASWPRLRIADRRFAAGGGGLKNVFRVYRYIDDDVPPEARAFVLSALADATDIAADGHDQFFGIPAALPDSEWAIKQGWMQIDNGLVLNTTGIVGSEERYVVVLLTRQPGGTSFEDGSAAVTAGIAALVPTLTADAH